MFIIVHDHDNYVKQMIQITRLEDKTLKIQSLYNTKSSVVKLKVFLYLVSLIKIPGRLSVV